MQEIQAAAYLDRRRLEDVFSRAAARRITLVCAPNGSGKSTAIGQHIRLCNADAVHYMPERDTTTLVAFVRGLADELARALPALDHGLLSAATSAAATLHPATTLAHWFVDHLAERAATIALDDLHLIEGRNEILEFIVRAIECSGPHVRWILGVRTTLSYPIASWLAAELAGLQIDETVLAFNGDEVRALVERFGTPNTARFDHTLAPRHAGRLMLALAGAPTPGDGADEYEHLLETATEALLRRWPEEQVLALHSLLHLPRLEAALVREIPLGPETVARAEGEAPYGLRLPHERHFTRAFEAIVERKSSARIEQRVQAAESAIRALEHADLPRAALRVAVRAGAVAAMSDVLERHGFAIADAGYGDLIDHTLHALSPAQRAKSFAALALEAMRESDLGRHDVADSWFAHAADIAPDEAARFRVQYVYAGNLLRRGRLDCIDILEGLAAQRLSPELDASVIATLGVAYGSAQRWQEARARIDEALIRIDDISDVSTRASVYQSAAYVALSDHDADAAEHYAELALSLSDEHGYDRIAILAHSVRYVVASSYRDDVAAAMRAIESLQACAKRLGNALFRRYALLGMIESHAERGDRDELERAERALAAEELENEVEHAEEALIPSRAMRVAWTGDFGAAYRLLASSAERQMSIDQRASRWSEIAVYAAAAELEDAAFSAISVARSALRGAAFPSGATVRARLNLALASLLLGRLRAATSFLAATERAASSLPRLRKFQALLQAMLERRRGADNHEEILTLLEAMDDAGLGGISRTIEVVPDREPKPVERSM